MHNRLVLRYSTFRQNGDDLLAIEDPVDEDGLLLQGLLSLSVVADAVGSPVAHYSTSDNV